MDWHQIWNVRFGPIADITPLIRPPRLRVQADRVVGNSERFDGSEIDDHLEFGRLRGQKKALCKHSYDLC